MEGTNELWCRIDVPEEQGSASANAWFMLPLLLTSVPEDGTAPITTRSFTPAPVLGAAFHHLLTTGTCFPRRFGRKPGPCINSGVGWG